MPLVIVSGLPCSGKTSRSKELAAYLSQHSDKKVILISEEDVGASRLTSYTNATEEKKARGNFFSAVERACSKDTLVIADGLNYIKGYRYQLYCVARAAGTPHCVLHCVASESLCRDRNSITGTYASDIFEELLMRYEEPNNQTRWDSPLFTVGEEEMDWKVLVESLMGSVARPPSFSTAVKTQNSGDLVMALDKVTQSMLEKLQGAIKTNGVPTTVEFTETTVPITRPLMSSELQRLRRQFIHMNRLHKVDPDNIETLFAQYLATNLK